MQNMTTRVAVAVAASMTLAACDLDNPDHPVLDVAIAESGTTALFFLDGIGIVDPLLNGFRFLPYPDRPADQGTYALSHDGTRAAVGWNAILDAQPDGTVTEIGQARIEVFDIDNGWLAQAFEVQHRAIGLSDDGARLVVARADAFGAPENEELSVFDVNNGSQLWSMPSPAFPFVLIPGANAVAVAVLQNPDGGPVTQPPTLSIRDLDTGAVQLEIPLTQIPPDEFGVTELAASPDGSVLAVAVGAIDRIAPKITSHILLFNVSDGTLMRDLEFPDSEPWHLALSSGAQQVAAVFLLGVSQAERRPTPWELAMWDGAALASRTPIDVALLGRQGIALSPDGTLLVAAKLGEGVGVYSVPAGDELLERKYKQDLF